MGMTRLAEYWKIDVPASLAALYTAADGFVLGPLEFFSLDRLLAGERRAPGMLPQFLPFAETDEGEIAGFYVRAPANEEECPVLLWEPERGYYYPVAPSMDAFLAWSLVQGRYLLSQELEDEAGTVNGWRRLLSRAGLPCQVLDEAVPRNERELNARLCRGDIESAEAVLQAAAASLAEGNLAEAARRLEDAEQDVPWFGDAHYLKARAHLMAGTEAAAVDEWLRTIRTVLCFTTHTDRYNLGPEAPEEYIRTLAAAELSKRRCTPPNGMEADPLWQSVASGRDIGDASLHLELAEAYAELGRTDAQERELLSALTLAFEADELAEVYDRLVAFYTAIGGGWSAEWCRRDRRLLDGCPPAE